jgi:lysophospholipid acyltransferase (LPLAT)-like uncharacterized protein
MPSWNKQVGEARWVQSALGTVAAGYLRLVWITSRFTLEPPDF